MKFIFVFVALLTLCSIAMAQPTTGVLPPNMRASIALDKLSSMTPGDLIYGIPLPPKEVVGDSYLNEEWRSTTLMLYSSDVLIEGFPVKYDMLRDEFEIQSKSGIKVIDGKKVKSFIWIDQISNTADPFINAREFKNEENTPLRGFFNVMVDGKMPLFKKTEAYIKKADYNASLDVGHRNDRILKREKLFYAVEGKVFEVPSAKKKFLLLFEEQQHEVNDFIKSNDLSLGNESHLKRVFEFYNSMK
jgi:hypothetical protein